jgi:glutathione S-transferase
MPPAALTIYGDSSSGNCLKVKFVADRLTLPYAWVEINVMEKGTRSPEFLKLTPAGQVPVAHFAGRGGLAKSNDIMLHLARDSGLIPQEAWDRALMQQWLFWDQYSDEPALAVLRFQKHYLKKPESEIDPGLKPRCDRAQAMMEQHLADRRYFVGERLSLVDIALVAYTRFAHQANLDLAHWPKVREWVHRIESDLKIEPAR